MTKTDFFIAALLLVIVFTGCKKQSEQLNLPTMQDYFPLEVGKVSYYKLDSSILAGANTRFEVNSYHIKDSVESTFTDNTGRLSYRIFRFITDTAELQPWQPYGTAVVTQTSTQTEFNENNLKFIKLVQPVTEGYSWKGNAYIDTKSDLSEVKYFDDWDYTYSNVAAPFTDTIVNRTYENTVTVMQADEWSPYGPEDRTLPFQQRKYGIEVYAKGKGLVYKDLWQWVWQGQAGHYEDNGFRVMLTFLK